LSPYHIRSVQALVPHDATARRTLWQWFCNSRSKTLQFYSWTNRASVGLGSPAFTRNTYRHVKFLMQLDLTVINDSCPLICGIRF
jgi:hypothetical protein